MAGDKEQEQRLDHDYEFLVREVGAEQLDLPSELGEHCYEDDNVQRQFELLVRTEALSYDVGKDYGVEVDLSPEVLSQNGPACSQGLTLS